MTERLTALLSAGFGLLATLLAAIGLYGVMAFVVARRTKELGLRMALGAHAGSVVWIVMNEVLLLLGIGLAVGVPSALALSRFVATQLYGIKATDTGIAAAACCCLLWLRYGGVDSRAPGQPDRSDSGTPVRVREFCSCTALRVLTPGLPVCNHSCR